jgi:hypothetical protein
MMFHGSNSSMRVMGGLSRGVWLSRSSCRWQLRARLPYLIPQTNHSFDYENISINAITPAPEIMHGTILGLNLGPLYLKTM